MIIPTIPERAELLTRAVASVTAQTLQPDEIAIAVARPDEPAWSTRQRALDMVTADFVACLDDDDEFLPHHLERCAAWQADTGADWQADTGADVVFPWFEVVGGTDPFPGEFGTPWDPEHPRETTTVIFARRTAMVAVGGYRFADGDRLADGSHRAGEDSDLIKRMNAAGCRISHLPERTWRWHHHYGNTSGIPERRRVQ